MIRKFKNIASLLLLLVFVLPSIVKLEHHHEHLEYIATQEKHYHEFHGKCAVCDFEFSIFPADIVNVVLPKEQPIAKRSSTYSPDNYSTFSKYSFLLRAPPYREI